MSFESEFIEPQEGRPRGAEEVPLSERINDLEATLRPEGHTSGAEAGYKAIERPVSDFGAPDSGGPTKEPEGRTVPIDLSKILGEGDDGRELDKPNSADDSPESPPTPEPGESGSGDGGEQPPEELSGEQDPEERPARFRDIQPEGPLIATTEISRELSLSARIHGLEVERAPISHGDNYHPKEVDVPMSAHRAARDAYVDPKDPREVTRDIVSMGTGQEIPRDEQGRPLFEYRTGLTGRGAYNLWGPNPTATDVITRYNSNQVLEVLVTVDPPPHGKMMAGALALPETFVDEGETKDDAIRRLREEYRVYDVPPSSDGKVVYADIADRPATDNAWQENSVTHTHLGEAESLAADREGETTSLWIPVNHLLSRVPAEDIAAMMEPHQAKILELIADREYQKACQPQFPDSITTIEDNGDVVEEYQEKSTTIAKTANGDTVELPYIAPGKRIISRGSGPAPHVDIVFVDKIDYNDLPIEAKDALGLAKMMRELELPTTGNPVPYFKLAARFDPESEDNLLYVIPPEEGMQPINKTPGPDDARVNRAQRTDQGYVAIPERRRHREGIVYDPGQIGIFCRSLLHPSNAFWVSGRPLVVTNDPTSSDEYIRYIIFPAEFFYAE